MELLGPRPQLDENNPFELTVGALQIHEDKTLGKGITCRLVSFDGGEGIRIPAYLLEPKDVTNETPCVLAIPGHGIGIVEMIGLVDPSGAYRQAGLHLAQRGYRVLAIENRGFGYLRDLGSAAEWTMPYLPFSYLGYYLYMRGRCIIGDTTFDLLRGLTLLRHLGPKAKIGVVGLSYGGDLALLVSALDKTVMATFASGTVTSMEVIFNYCRNKEAHVIPRLLLYGDRSDIAALIAPRPLAIQWGELDVLSPHNESCSFNPTSLHAFAEIKEIYRDAGAPENLIEIITPNQGHILDVKAMDQFLAEHL